MFSDVSFWNLKKKILCFQHDAMIPDITLDGYAHVYSGAKYTLHLIHFNYSVLKLKLH